MAEQDVEKRVDKRKDHLQKLIQREQLRIKRLQDKLKALNELESEIAVSESDN